MGYPQVKSKYYFFTIMFCVAFGNAFSAKDTATLTPTPTESLGVLESFLESILIDPSIICATTYCSNSATKLPTTTTTKPPNTSTNPPPRPKPLPKICKACIRSIRLSIRIMGKKIPIKRRQWLWGCKFTHNKTHCVEAIDNFAKEAQGRHKEMCPFRICVKTGFCPVNCTSSDTPHSHVEVESSSPSSSSVSIKSVPMIKLKPAAYFVQTETNQVKSARAKFPESEKMLTRLKAENASLKKQNSKLEAEIAAREADWATELGALEEEITSLRAQLDSQDGLMGGGGGSGTSNANDWWE